MKTIVSSIIFAVWLAIGSNAVAVSGVAIVAATGGSAISADTTGGTYTTLVGPTITENNPGGIGTGTIILTVPSGFIFNTSSAVTVTLTHTGSGTGDMVLASTTAVVSSTTITITVNTQTTGSRLAKLAFSGIQVRPTAGAPLSTGNITKSGTAAYTETGSVGNYGTLTETVGAVSKLITTLPGQTFTSGVGNSGTVSTQTAGTAFNISRLTATDQFTNLVTTYTGAKTISYTGPSGTTLYTTAVTFSSGVSTTTLSTTLRTAETTTITASATGLTGIPSSPLTVSPGATATRLQILLPGETAVPGTSTGKTGTPTTIAAQTPISATVNLTDTNWNVVSSSDTVHLTSSDSVAVLPANGSLIGGTGSFSVTLKTRTTSTISVSDVTNGTVTSGTSTAITVTNNPPVLSSINDMTGALEDTTFTISYATLLAQSDLTDIDVNAVDVLSFRVAAISSGTLTQSGTNVVAGSTFLTPTSAAFVWRAATNVNGTLNAFTVRGYDGTAFSTSTVQVRSVVTAINDVPSFTKGTNQTGLEDSAARTVSNWATSISTGPADEATQTIAFIVSNNNSNLFSVQPAVSSSGTLTYTLAANANGTATVSIAAQDNGGILNGGVDTSAAQTFTVTITGVNDAPGFTKGSDITLDEDAGAQSFSGWATAISAGPSDEITQTLTFTTSNNNSNLFSVQPTLSSNGTLSFTPSSNTNGSATVTVTLRDNGGTTNNGIDTSASQTFVITVNPVNDAPTLNALSDLSVLEDAATQIVALAGISTGPNEASQTLSFSASSSDSNVISSLSITYTSGSTGTLRYTPVANANGTATITVTAQDSGGTANSGIDTITRSFAVTVTAVNDQPTLNTIGNVSVYEGSGIQTISLSGIGVGPTNETSQSITNFTAVSSNTNLVANPSIAYVGGSSATLTYSAPGTGSGTATITVTAQDDGGTANAGANAVTRTFTVTVMQINHAPTIDTIADRSTLEDAGAQTITLTGISTGLNESGQSLTNFVATSSNTNLIFNPTILYTNGYSTAILSFTPQTNANGTATITVTAQDNGGTANSGTDIITRSFTVTVTAVNDQPTLNTIGNVSVYEGSGTQTISLSGIGVGPTNETGQSITNFTAVSSNTNLVANPSVAYVSGSSGTLTYSAPVAGTGTGTTTVTVTAQDDGGTANAGANAVTRTFTVTLMQINHAPTIDTIADRSTLEDAGAQTITLTGITTGLSESGQSLTNYVATSNNTNLICNPTIRYTNGYSTAILSFTPRTNANGTATITVSLQDDGGTANSGIDTTTKSFNVTVTAVNDLPSFAKGTNILLRTTTSAQTISNWASSITAGPTNESAQSLSFHVSNDNNAMFSVQPSVSTNGTLTFTASGNGTANVAIYLQDDGGTANVGSDTSAIQTFSITVYPINIAPSFAMSTNLTILEDAGVQVLTNWATNIIAGPTDEAAQTLSVSVTNDNSALFAVQPSLSTNGVLTFTPADNAFGSAVVTVVLQDDGGTAYTGADTSTQTFILNITPINDAPSFTKGLDINLDVTAPRYQAISGWASNISAGAKESSQTVTFVLTNDSPAQFAQQPAISADGTLTFEIAPAASNVLATISVYVTDNGGVDHQGTNTSATQIFHLSLSSSYGTPSILAAGQGPTGLYLGNLRGLTFEGATKSGGPRYRDMIVANSLENTVSVRFCNDDGTFTPATSYPVGLSPFGVISGDFDRDGFDEIVTANSGTNSISVLQNNIDRTFAPAVDYQIGSSSNPEPIAVTVNDFNGDGRLDIVVANRRDNSVSVLLGLGNSTFGSCTNFPVGNGPMSVWTGDLNGDKKVDIITANKDANTLTILPGLGNGNFGPAQTIPLNGNPQPTYAITFDLNGDGKLDIVVANYASNTVSVLLKQADGSFQVSSNYPVGINPRSVLARDLDRDGKIDIACANSGSASVSILRNRGDGTFDYAGNFPAGGNPLIVWASNFDDDDAADIAISNYGDNTISILRYAGPLAYASQLSLLEDHSVAVTLKGRILSGSTLTYQIATNPAHGTLTGTAPNLVYTPDTNYYGTDVFSYQVTYTGGDLILNSAKATVTLKISPVNDAPLFSLSTGGLSLTNFNTLQTLPGFATGISAGSIEERGQQLTFTVTTTNKTLFDIQPKLSSDGTLSFRTALNKEGVATVAVRLSDNGGILYGGTNSSTVQTFTITVLPNPLMRLKGVYNGLFYETAGAQNASSGFFNLTLTDKRTFSGKLMITGKSYTLSGTLGTNGIAQVTIPRTNQNALGVTFSFDLTGGSNDQITGTVTDGGWNSYLLGDRNVYNALTNPAPQAGKYTLVIGGNPGDASKPAGDGVGLVTVKTDGTATLSGTLADGTAVAQSVPLSKNGEWPLYVSLYGGNGSILGWVTFTNTVESSLEGDLNWIKTGAAGGKYYPLGFTNDTVTVGSVYNTPAAGTRFLSLTNGFAEVRDGNLSGMMTNRFTLGTNNVFSVTAAHTNSMALVSAPVSGIVTGGFVNPRTKARLAIRAVVLQKQAKAYGFFLGTNQSGLFLLHE